jgi:hypothetical protein
MSLILDGTNGLSDVDGSAATPAIRGSDANTGIFFPAADTIAFAEGGAEVMRINSSGNVGIGTSTPGTKFDVSNGTMQASQTATSGTSTVYATNSGNNSVGFWKQGSTAGSYGVIAAENGAVFNSSGDLCIVNDASSKNIIFANNGAALERMRIDSSGNLLVGTTSATSKITLKQGADSAAGGMAFVRGDSTNYFSLLTGSDNNFYFGYNGTSKANINSSTGAYSALSDARLKVNVTDSAKGLSVVTALRPVEYQVKDDSTGANQIGLIAQEVLEILPEVVSVPAADDYFYGMNYSGVVPVLVKAIQEQQAIITALTARVEALEGAQA